MPAVQAYSSVVAVHTVTLSHWSRAVERYLKAATTWPSDDEQSIYSVIKAVEAAWHGRCEIRRIWPVLKDFNERVAAAERIWEHSADWDSFTQRVPAILAFQQRVKAGIAYGACNLDTSVRAMGHL